MDLVKEFDIDVDLLIAKTAETKQRVKELKIESGKLRIDSNEFFEVEQEILKLQFEFDTYCKYLWVYLRGFKPKSNELKDVLEYQQKILEVYILTSKNDNTDLQKRIDLAKMEYEKDTDKEKAGFKLLETLTSISVENAEKELEAYI